jgi:hypothetical protein
MKGEAIMRRIFRGRGTLVLVLTMLMWAAVPISAQYGGYGGGGHPPAHIGSVHYGTRSNLVQVGPGVWTGSVRSEHYTVSPYRGAYRSPYRDDYFSHFRTGYQPFVLGDSQYYYYMSLPVGFQQVVVGGVVYYLFDDVYYLPYIYRGQTVFLVVPNQ